MGGCRQFIKSAGPSSCVVVSFSILLSTTTTSLHFCHSMLSIADLLNPLPAAGDATNPDVPVSPLTNRHVTPDLYMDGIIIDGADNREASPPLTRANPCSSSSPPVSRPYCTPCHARILSPLRELSESPPRSQSSSPLANLRRTAEYNVSLNRKTTLKTLYHYPLGAVVEYPETSCEGSVGHLFDVSADDWLNPRANFVYAQGEPSGRTKGGQYIWCNLLVDNDSEKVPCREIHSTCMYTYYAI